MAKVQINYRSGISIEAECEDFTVKRGPTGGKAVEWENMVPRPLMFGIEDVESIWVISEGD